jgi:hypothetical protein
MSYTYDLSPAALFEDRCSHSSRFRKALSSARHFTGANDAQVAPQPCHGSAPAKRARPSNASSIRSASFHFAMRSERENEPTLS